MLPNKGRETRTGLFPCNLIEPLKKSKRIEKERERWNKGFTKIKK